MEELVSAIKSFPSGKAAGPDGFSSDNYKAVSDILIPLLLRIPQKRSEDIT